MAVALITLTLACFAVLLWKGMLSPAARAKAAASEAVVQERLALVRRDGSVPGGIYVQGHPVLNGRIGPIVLFGGEEAVEIVPRLASAPLARIPLAAIEDVTIQDHSYVVTTGASVIGMGSVAVATARSKGVDVRYLVIKWRDGRFVHQTTTNFAGPQATAQANEACTAVMQWANAASAVA